MKLIADSGSTKTDWRVIEDDGGIRAFSSEGMNPAWDGQDALSSKLEASEVGRLLPDEVWFYGAGVGGSRKKLMEGALGKQFPEAETHADSDMVGAARAVLGRQDGLAAILGTGMNSCRWDGEKMVAGIPPLGFMLGDEGSGGSIGKALLKAWMRGDVPQSLQGELTEAIGMDPDEVMEHIYRKPAPNRFCASFAKIVTDRKDEDGWFRDLLASCLRPFFTDVILRYPDATRIPLGIVGSVGWACKDMLTDMAASLGIAIGAILRSPIEGLVKFHTDRFG